MSESEQEFRSIAALKRLLFADSIPLVRMARAIDRESVIAMSWKLVNGASGVLLAITSAKILSPEEQGVFFTLLSFAFLPAFVELGLNLVLVQFVSHEQAHIRNAKSSHEESRARERLVSIGRFGLAWFAIGTTIFALVTSVAGFWFFDIGAVARSVLPWPWLLLVAGVATDLIMFPCWLIMEGAGYIRLIYTYRLIRGVAMYGGTWVLLMAGAKFYALSGGIFLTLPASFYMLYRHRAFLTQFRKRPVKHTVSWRRELLPLQWRVALASMATFVVNWMVTPISLRLMGDVAAGQIGMSWSIANGIVGLATALLLVKFARAGYLVANRDFSNLDRLALQQGALSVFVAALAGIAAFGGVMFARYYDPAFARRFLPLSAFGMIMLGVVIQQVTLVMAYYLRAFKQEPLLWQSLAVAALVLVSVIVFGKLYGAMGLAAGYLGVLAIVSLPSATTVFLLCRRRWHAFGAPGSKRGVGFGERDRAIL